MRYNVIIKVKVIKAKVKILKLHAVVHRTHGGNHRYFLKRIFLSFKNILNSLLTEGTVTILQQYYFLLSNRCGNVSKIAFVKPLNRFFNFLFLN